MSLTFKFDKLNEKNSENQDKKSTTRNEENIELYDSPSNARNLCFIDKTDKHYFLNYSYLISGEFSPQENLITLFFSTHIVSIKGVDLSSLFEELFHQKLKMIRCGIERYAVIKKDAETFVSEINVTKIIGL